VNASDASHGAHRHADDEIVIVKEGTMEVMINGQSSTAGAGSVLFFA
jgi:quercetin dioxygenase-like cupin family protein